MITRVASDVKFHIRSRGSHLPALLSGITGGWVERMVVAPTRDPGALDAADILRALEEDLVKICRERQWITARLCGSHRATLRELVAAIGGERQDEARERAADLLGDVEESWRAPQGELEPDAYWLLRRNLEAAIMRIGR